MTLTLREKLEKNVGRIILFGFLGLGVKTCLYTPLTQYNALTDSMKEVFDFKSEFFIDLNRDGNISGKEKERRDILYGECRSFLSDVSSVYWIRDDNQEIDRIVSCAKEKYNPH